MGGQERKKVRGTRVGGGMELVRGVELRGLEFVRRKESRGVELVREMVQP